MPSRAWRNVRSLQDHGPPVDGPDAQSKPGPEGGYEDPAAVYDAIAEPFSDASSSPSEHLDEWLDMLPAAGRMLDVGCGPGADCRHAATRGFGIVGLDTSRGLVAQARKKSPGLDFRLGDMRSVPMPEAEFDGVASLFSLIHIPKQDVAGVLRRFRAWLKPGGLLLLGLQEGPSQETALPEPLSPGHSLFLNVMTTEEAEGLLAEAGFQVLHRHLRDAQPGEFPFRKLHVVARRD
jgi:SAM-dependent methyltransferase